MALRSIEKSEPFAFFDKVKKGETVVLKETMEIASRANRLLITIPSGPEGDLRIRAFFLDSKGTPREFINFVGAKDYFDGDDVIYDIPLDVPIEAYSTIVVVGQNLTDISLGYDYDLNVVIDVSYEVGDNNG